MTETLEGIRALISPIIVIVLGMIVLLMDLGAPTAQRRRQIWGLSLLGLAGAALAASVQLGIQTLASNVKPDAIYFGEGMISDRLGALFCIVLCIIAGLSILMSDRYLDEKGINQGEFYSLVLFSTSGAMLMALSYDLVNVFVGLEVLSVSLYILAGFSRRELRSEEAAVKYFLLGAFASGFLLFGTALVYGAVGLAVRNGGLILENPHSSFTNFYVIGEVLRLSAESGAPLAATPLFVAGVALVIVGLGFKAAIVPFHSYAPDVYEGAPTPVTAFMSAGAKAGAFAAFIRFFQVLLSVEGGSGPYRYVLWGLAAATMVVGNVLAVRQTNIKRMLAYSSIAHAGYILVGVLASGSVSGGSLVQAAEVQRLAQSAVLHYLFVYTFMNLGAFAVIIWLGRGGREYLNIRDYNGLAKEQPFAAAVMTVFLLSLAGIPPIAGFFGKLYLFLSAVYAGYPGLAVLGVLTSVIGVYYYLSIVVAMYFRQPEQDFAQTRRGGAYGAAIIAAIACIVLGIIRVGVFSPSFGSRADAPRPAPSSNEERAPAPAAPPGRENSSDVRVPQSNVQ